MSLYRTYFLLLVSCVAFSAQAAWNVGSFYVPKLTEAVELQELREGAQSESAQYVSGLLRVSGSSREDAFLIGSNGLAYYYTMPGELAFERFEQQGAYSPESQQRSRLILHITEGILTVDSSSLAEGSQCIVETPLGRVSAGSGRWTLNIAYDTRTRIYNFTLESIDVDLSFKTRLGERFVVQAGQMLMGAGPSTLPDLELAELLNSAQERIDTLDRLIEGAMASLSKDELNAKLRPLAYKSRVGIVDSTNLDFGESAEAERPIVIEYSPRPRPLVPFRGVVKPPSEYQKDLF